MAHALTPPLRRYRTRVPSFQYLLLSLVTFMVFQPYMLHGRMGYLLFFASEGALLVTGVLAASLVTRWRRRLTFTLAAAAALCRAGNFVGLAAELDLTAQLVFLAFVVSVTWSLIRTLLEHPTVQRNTLYGAACAYLLIGLSFTALYVVLEHVHPPALAADLARLGRADLAWADVVFFSFMTLTTVGYGDITPVSSEARLVALFEAVAGVFFLAFRVARLVALYRTDESAGPP
jgi:voltage-gated potassium channel